jgi:hypothetical protein
MHPSDVLDIKPWTDGVVMLPPTCILRAYQLVEEKEAQHLSSSSSSMKNTISIDRVSSDTSAISSRLNREWVYDAQLPKIEMKHVIQVNFMEDYLDQISLIRIKAEKHHLATLFHYTSPSILPFILKGGMRMSTQGQGDGGVYFSLRGPLSYGLGKDEYEVNIIKDCFGVERVNEYLGKGKLDALIVYGCDPGVLVQAPGGRDNAKMVPKSYFTSLMLPQADGNYFLRPDRILGVFVMSRSVGRKQQLLKFSREAEVESEIAREKQTREGLDETFTESNKFGRELADLSVVSQAHHHHKNDNEVVVSGEESVNESVLIKLSSVYGSEGDSILEDTDDDLGSSSSNASQTIRRLSDNPLFRPRKETLDSNPAVSMRGGGNGSRYASVTKNKHANKDIPSSGVVEVEMETFVDNRGEARATEI